MPYEERLEVRRLAAPATPAIPVLGDASDDAAQAAKDFLDRNRFGSLGRNAFRADAGFPLRLLEDDICESDRFAACLISGTIFVLIP